MPIAIKRKAGTVRFLKDTCKGFDKPFTIRDLMDAMHGRRYNYPTTRELQMVLKKLDFIDVVGKEETNNGMEMHYRYVGD